MTPRWVFPFLVAVFLGAGPVALSFAADRSPSRTVAVEISDGQIQSAIQQLDALAEQLLDSTGVPGLAVAVAWRGETVYGKGFGLRKIGGTEKVDRDTVFQIASLSKPVAASVVARQVGEGIVAWDTPLVSLLPWFALADPWVTEHVTIGDLFSHRSGLPDHAGDDLEDLGFDRRQVLERLRYLPLAPFRATYAYTNFGLTAAAEAVATASGRDWASLSQDVLYGPLAMASTSSRYADYLARVNRAHGHILIAGEFVSGPQRQPDAQSPAGGVSSSVADFARWMAMVLGRGRLGDQTIIEETAMLPAVTGQIVSAPSATPDARAGLYGHGFGVSIKPSGRVALSHSGAFYLGAGTNFVLLPSEALGIAVFTNATPVGAAEALAAQFMDLVQFGEITRDWPAAYGALFAALTAPEGELVGQAPPANPAPARALSSYLGTYGNSYFGDARVALEDSGLGLEIGPAGQSYPMTHWSGDVFSIALFGENAPSGSISKVTFGPDDGGPVGTMTIELLDESRLGTFTRRR